MIGRPEPWRAESGWGMHGRRAVAGSLSEKVAMFDSARLGIRRWLVEQFVQAIRRTAQPEDRHAAIVWLLRSRDILASDLGQAEALKALDEQIKARASVSALADRVAAVVEDYQTAKVPWAVKIAIPATLRAKPGINGPGTDGPGIDGPVAGPHGAGLAAFGTAIGRPALLLVFLGAAGITAIIGGVVANPCSEAAIALVAARILRAEASRRAATWVTAEMVNDPVAPCAAAMPVEEAALRATLLAMESCAFERHVMSFFERVGLEAVVTPQGKERGLDGYACHAEGLIAVQCKRYGMETRVGSPAVQQFRTVMADANAWRGYLVTTSCLTAGAVSCAMKETGLHLVDLDALVRWHTKGFALAA